jgi:hypothetical protein
LPYLVCRVCPFLQQQLYGLGVARATSSLEPAPFLSFELALHRCFSVRYSGAFEASNVVLYLLFFVLLLCLLFTLLLFLLFALLLILLLTPLFILPFILPLIAHLA